jgi:hypothetical protein
MQKTINAKRYDTKKCVELGRKEIHNYNNNYCGSNILYVASDNQVLIEITSNGQDLYRRDNLFPIEDSSFSIDDFDMTDEQAKLAEKHGLLTIVE